MALFHQIVPNDAPTPKRAVTSRATLEQMKPVTRNVTPALEAQEPVTRDVTLEERVRMLEAKVALLEAGAPKASSGRAAYMRTYRAKQKGKA